MNTPSRNESPTTHWHSAHLGVVAPSAGWAPPLRYLLRRARILEAVKHLQRGTLLEVGCGAGALLCDLSDLGFDAIGLETSTSALAMARQLKELTSGPHRIVDSPDPAWTGSMDLVCSFDVLEHIEDDHAALTQWVDWLKPGGRLLVSVPAHQSRWGAGDRWAGHWRRYDRAPLINMIERQGLTIEHFECYGFPLANMTEWLGNHHYRKLIAQRGEVSNVEATSHSGTERSAYLKLAGHLGSLPGRWALSTNFLLQRLARHTDYGSGYLLMARRP